MALDSNSNVMRTGGGVEIRLSDSSPQVNIRSPEGTNITLDGGRIILAAAGATLTLENGSIHILTGRIVLDAPMVTAQVIQCDTIIANSVVGSNYTPGAGNVW